MARTHFLALWFPWSDRGNQMERRYRRRNLYAHLGSCSLFAGKSSQKGFPSELLLTTFQFLPRSIAVVVHIRWIWKHHPLRKLSHSRVTNPGWLAKTVLVLKWRILYPRSTPTLLSGDDCSSCSLGGRFIICHLPIHLLSVYRSTSPSSYLILTLHGGNCLSIFVCFFKDARVLPGFNQDCLFGKSPHHKVSLNSVFLLSDLSAGGGGDPHKEVGGPRAWGRPATHLSLEPCRWSPGLTPRVSPCRLTSFGLMMIDYGGFFITLNLISAWSNLSNDCSLLAIVKFKSCFMRLHRQPVGRCWGAFWFTHLLGGSGNKGFTELSDGQEVVEVLQKLHYIFSWQEILTVPTRSNVIIKETVLTGFESHSAFYWNSQVQ